MKLLRFTLDDFCSQLRQQFKIYLIIILALGITFSSSLIIMKALLVTSSDMAKVLEQKRTYYLNMLPDNTPQNSNKTYQFIKNLTHNSEYPEIEELDTINLVAMEDIEVKEDSFMTIKLEAVLNPDTYDHNLVEKPKMVEGHWITENSNTEQNSIVLSSADRDMLFPEAHVGDRIDLVGNEFIILGIVSNRTSSVPFDCVGNLNNFMTKLSSIKFKSQLSKGQLNEIQSQINELGKTEEVTTMYSMLKTDMFFNYLIYIVLILVVMIFCICNTSSLFRYLAIMKMYDFNVYKICGMGKKQLKAVFYMQTLCIGVISCLIGSLFYFVLLPVQTRFGISVPLPTYLVIFILLTLMGILLLSVRPVINRLAKRPPIDRIFWR